MVWTAAQTTAFFTGAEQMALTAETRVKIQEEGIASADDLTEFDMDSIADCFKPEVNRRESAQP